MEIEFQAGMASRFFLTDAKKGIAVLSGPAVVFTQKTITLDLLAEVFEKLFNASVRKGLFGPLVKNAEAEKIKILLKELAEQQKLSHPAVGVPGTVLVLANGIDQPSLTAMKALNLRGLSRLLAVNLSSSGSNDLPLSLQEAWKGEKVFEDAASLVYKPCKHLCAVSNLERTIIATDRSPKDILNTHPGVVLKLDDYKINNDQDFINEGRFN